MHSSAEKVPREKRIEQIESKDPSVKNYKTYIPISNSVQKIQKWVSQGAEVFYLTSRRGSEVSDIKEVLLKYEFPQVDNLIFRKGSESYADIAERIRPDILIEDDCESMGDEQEVIYPNISKEVKKNVKSVIVKEFEGIDHLGDKIACL
jgi:hypothetical protein